MQLLDLLADLFERLGLWPVVVIVGLYVVLNGRLSFTYPRDDHQRREDI